MKRIVTFILLLTLSLGLFSGCKGEKYPEIESTKEEAAVVMTLQLDGEEYEIRYELYRALFLSNKSEVDGGDGSVWSGEEADKYIDEINGIIINRAGEIFAALHLAKKLGINPESKEIESKIKEYIRISVEGNDGDVGGFGGDYDAYLDSLYEKNLNYSVQKLMIRYSIVLEEIDLYYKGSEDEVLGHIDGKYEFSEGDVREYYFGEDCVRIMQAYVQEGIISNIDERMAKLHSDMKAIVRDLDMALYIINNTSATPTDLIRDGEVSGILLGRNTLGDGYKEYTEAAFNLPVGGLSEIIKLSGEADGRYIIYKVAKDESHFSHCYDDVCESYLDDLIGGELMTIKDALASSAKRESGYSDINHEEIGR